MRVIKKRRGKEEYFYLRHSFRRGSKVKTKDLYLGKEIPKNIEEIKREMLKEEIEATNTKLEKIRENFQKEWQKYPESVKERELEEIAIAFTYNTNAIEGSEITLGEAREIIREGISPNKSLKDVRETAAHSKVFLEMLAAKEKITRELILEWHKDIFGETKTDIAGRFRNYLVRVGNYVAPDWQDVEKMVKQLADFIKSAKINPVELAARAHYRFERIHPFGDGNGRIGRLLMNRILWHAGYPMLIIEKKRRRIYYKALQSGEDGFTKYFLRRYLTVNKKRYEA